MKNSTSKSDGGSQLDVKQDKSVAVCFVCLGNICRSPTAEGVFRHLVAAAQLDGKIHIDSAGTAAYHSGELADRRSASFAARRGYDLLSVARQFVPADFERFDYVLAMDSDNLLELVALKRRAKIATGHLGLFRAFDPSAPQGSSVPDPYYGGDAGFEEVLNQCERACAGLIAHLRQHHLL
jgi:protein-tyrosine phosphatase